MREPQDSLPDETSPPPWSVLVVIADPQLRQTVGWLLDDLALANTDLPSWRRRAVTTTDARPALAIGDLDDPGKNVAGVRSIFRSSWGEPVSFVILGHRANVAEIAVEVGAVAGLRKPVNVGLLIATVERTLTVVVVSGKRIVAAPHSIRQVLGTPRGQPGR